MRLWQFCFVGARVIFIALIFIGDLVILSFPDCIDGCISSHSKEVAWVVGCTCTIGFGVPCYKVVTCASKLISSYRHFVVCIFGVVLRRSHSTFTFVGIIAEQIIWNEVHVPVFIIAIIPHAELTVLLVFWR
jgi:hypothetical protein